MTSGGISFRFAEIFASLQGEGRNTGRPAVFLRFSGCNLKCPWCDTDHSVKFTLALDDVVRRVEESGLSSVIFTGGEPTVQPGIADLAGELRSRGFWIALESNGLKPEGFDFKFDYVALSPKPSFDALYRADAMFAAADEVRIVAENAGAAGFCRRMRREIMADDYYVSPLDSGGRPQLGTAMELLRTLNSELPRDEKPWALSVQTHKFIGIK